MENESCAKTKEEKCAIIDKRIADYMDRIKKLEARRELIINPEKKKNRRSQIKDLINQIEESGMTIEDIKKKMGIK